MSTDLVAAPPAPMPPAAPQPLAGEKRLREMVSEADAAAAAATERAQALRVEADQYAAHASDAQRHAQAYRRALEYLRSGR